LPRSLALALSIALFGAAGVARAESPTVRCQGRVSRDRAVLRLEVERLLDPELTRLVRLGLRGRLRVEMTLFRRRRLWFDERVGKVERTLAVSFTRGKVVIDGARVEGGKVMLEPLALWLTEAAEPDARYGIDAEARLEVVTAESLGRVADWIAGGEGSRPGAVSKNLLAGLASDLERRAQGGCAVEVVR
jgi:hypothetical protein